MNDGKVQELVNQLTDATREGRVRWYPTARTDEFTCSFKGRFSVLVGRHPDGGCYFQIVDADGQEILKVGGLLPLVELWNLASGAALKADQVIEDILEDLKRG